MLRFVLRKSSLEHFSVKYSQREIKEKATSLEWIFLYKSWVNIISLDTNILHNISEARCFSVAQHCCCTLQKHNRTKTTRKRSKKYTHGSRFLQTRRHAAVEPDGAGFLVGILQKHPSHFPSLTRTVDRAFFLLVSFLFFLILLLPCRPNQISPLRTI